MPKCKINNIEVEVPEGTSIIAAFKKINQNIAHYCWHPGLSVAGVCRLCMVDIEGIPKLQIACNIEIKEGMVISNQSEKVKEAVKWGLEFHLINHPLDCPICDQAGECELQEQYMHFGQYRPSMGERKVKKRKVVDLGSKIVLDTERCILCSRCVRFTDEISKTHELGIFNRGDHSEIGVFKDKPLNNNYVVNTVDICPVGALTSKDFRFRQRVWYLKTAHSICTGCSTGCNTKIDYNEEGLFRIRPRYNETINKHWMCDKGRTLYQLPNKKNRLIQALCPDKNINNSIKALENFKTQCLDKNNETKALILTAQYTLEEYEDIVSVFMKLRGGGADSIYYWKNNEKSFNDFDNLLLRGDKNPNTKGLLQILNKHNINTKWSTLEDRLNNKELNTLLVAGPENQKVYPDLSQKLSMFSTNCENILWWSAHPLPKNNLNKNNIWQIPSKTFFEKTGTYINFAGTAQTVKAVKVLVPETLSLSESSTILRGEILKQQKPAFLNTMKTNHFTAQKGVL